MSISLTPQEILELAMKINQTIQGLQNIEGILEDTRDNLTLAQLLKERADNASWVLNLEILKDCHGAGTT